MFACRFTPAASSQPPPPQPPRRARQQTPKERVPVAMSRNASRSMKTVMNLAVELYTNHPGIKKIVEENRELLDALQSALMNPDDPGELATLREALKRAQASRGRDMEKFEEEMGELLRQWVRDSLH